MTIIDAVAHCSLSSSFGGQLPCWELRPPCQTYDICSCCSRIGHVTTSQLSLQHLSSLTSFIFLDFFWKTHGFRPDVPRCYGKPVFKTQDSEELSKPRPEHAAVAALTAKAPTGSRGWFQVKGLLFTNPLDRWNDFAKHVEKIRVFLSCSKKCFKLLKWYLLICSAKIANLVGKHGTFFNIRFQLTTNPYDSTPCLLPGSGALPADFS